MNKLNKETSPYLLQHADNPVHWHAWRPEAFEKARKEDKPILVSIGYSTCHWCHVMERESFEDEAIAEYMNTHFVNIKVDREERPDVDQIYMDACQVISGSGGWPLNVFCTPDGKPFYAGTYYPPKPHMNRPSWSQVLQSIHRNYLDRRDVVLEQADKLTNLIKTSGRNLLEDDVIQLNLELSSMDLNVIYEAMLSKFDVAYGGFGGAPKFPQVSNLGFLLWMSDAYDLPEAEKHVHFSLEKMIRGGMYDHLGGGFMRYATDQAWKVPHFEKMLYDNALLLRLLANAWKVSKKDLYLEVIQQTLGFLQREMTGPDGGFYAALDADSEGEEGAYYVWSWEELEKILGADAPLVAGYYGMRPEGNWEGKNIVWRPYTGEDYIKGREIGGSEWEEKINSARALLFEAREKRIRPGLDDKYLLDWNAMMVSGLTEVWLATGLEEARDMALRNLAFIEQTFTGKHPKELKHVYTDRSEEKDMYPAYLDDYAWYIDAQLSGYYLDFDTDRILQASRYSDYLIDRFLEPETDLFYFTSGEEEDLPVRRQDIFDSSTPSGNSVMARNLLRLQLLLDKPAYRELAERMLKRVLDSVKKYPGSLCNWAIALFEASLSAKEIAVLGDTAGEEAKEILARFTPNMVLMAASAPNKNFPLLAEREAPENGVYIYLCKNYSCQLPVSKVEDLIKQLQVR
ncbi:MAG: thioredoxin domain-containing protein [Bacteroidetes bacterium]|nr:thioredoxin domain-containing protein [Bacteroidota bacterium]